MKRIPRVLVFSLSLVLVPGLGPAAAPLAAEQISPSPGTAGPLPESVKFWVLFRQMQALEGKAVEAEKSGLDGRPYRNLIRDGAKLTEGQDAQLRSIAADCLARVAEKDQAALKIIRAARAAAPKGQLKKGEPLPEPPEELRRLQGERDALIEAARDDLHRIFGDQEFQRFQSFVDEKVAPAIRSQTMPAPGGAR